MNFWWNWGSHFTNSDGFVSVWSKNLLAICTFDCKWQFLPQTGQLCGAHFFPQQKGQSWLSEPLNSQMFHKGAAATIITLGLWSDHKRTALLLEWGLWHLVSVMNQYKNSASFAGWWGSMKDTWHENHSSALTMGTSFFRSSRSFPPFFLGDSFSSLSCVVATR